jgi:hypothetical protein
LLDIDDVSARLGEPCRREEQAVKLDPNKHYINKSHTKHYYLNDIFTNEEWLNFINNKFVHGKMIHTTNKYRKIPDHCDRWYNQDNGHTTIAKPCPNKPYYKSNTNVYFCKYCAKEVNRINSTVTFTKIEEE